MSQENVEIVRKMIESGIQHDDGLGSVLRPRRRVDARRAGGGERSSGAMTRWPRFRCDMQTWDDCLRSRKPKAVDLGDCGSLARSGQDARYRQANPWTESGAPAASRRQGTSFALSSHGEALEAVGLSEQDAHADS